MKLRKWLKNIDPIGLTLVVWDVDVPEDEGPIYEGSAYDLPWWIGEAKISRSEDNPYDPPISFRDSLGKELNNKPGVVVTIKFKEA